MNINYRNVKVFKIQVQEDVDMESSSKYYLQKRFEKRDAVTMINSQNEPKPNIIN